MSTIATIPGGQSKGTPITEADEKSITYWVNRISGDLEANPQKKYADKDRQWIAAAKAELARRKGAPAPAAAAPTAMAPVHHAAPIQRASAQGVIGSYRDPNRINQIMSEVVTWGHLVTAAPACGTVPEGCSVAVSAVMIDPSETYEIDGGKLGLSKVALDRIAGAAGFDWDPNLTRRLDNAADPHYCHFKAVGYVKDFDGSLRTLPGEVEIDLRDGSDEAAKSSPKQLAQTRRFILRHAESKAMNRAIRKLGVRTGYTREELSKPFVCLRMLFTGETKDPELKREFARGIMDRFHGSHSAMFGGAPAAALPAGHAPPPLGSVPSDDEAIEPSYFADAPPAMAAPPAPPTPKPVPTSVPVSDADRAAAIDRGEEEVDRGDTADAY